MLDVRRMEVLSAAIREGSLTAAARRLGVTAGAASQAIGALEAQAGVALLERLPRGVRATPAGERLAAHADAVLAALRRAEDEVAGRRVDEVRIAAFPTAVAGLVPALLDTLAKRRPDLQVRIIEAEGADARALLRAGQCDVALVNHDALLVPDLHGPWQVVHLRDEPVWLAVAPTHALAGRAALAMGQLADEPWVTQLPASPCQEIVQRACAAAGFAPHVVATCGDYRSILALVGAGHGVSLVPQLALAGLADIPVTLVATRPVIRRRINALAASRPGAAASARIVLDALAASEPDRAAERSTRDHPASRSSGRAQRSPVKRAKSLS